MFEKNLSVAYLLDFYGSVLPTRTRSVMDSYYNDDLSLSEIAEGEGISRQGVRHLIKRGEDELQSLEIRLGIAAQYTAMQNAARRLLTLTETFDETGNGDTEDLRRAARTLALSVLQKEELPDV